jgi:hypothetical protein
MKKRVKIPMRNTKTLLDLAKKVREKHLADGEASPLKVLNWAEVSPMIDDVLEIEDRALRLNREKLLTYQHRRVQLSKLISVMRNSRDILTGVHSSEMKELGLWGYDVVEVRRNGTQLPAVEPGRAQV